MHKETLSEVEDYNKCVERCQQPLYKLRFELEFQLREWQFSLNECFHYCKLDTSSPIECNINCLRMHQGFLRERIIPKM